VLAAREVSHTRVNHLRGALNDMKKHNMTPVEFFAKMKGLSSEVTAIGKSLLKMRWLATSSIV
jgi:hypothetical protein